MDLSLMCRQSLVDVTYFVCLWIHIHLLLLSRLDVENSGSEEVLKNLDCRNPASTHGLYILISL